MGIDGGYEYPPRKNIELGFKIIFELKKFVGGLRRVRLVITGPPENDRASNTKTYLDRVQALIQKLNLTGEVLFIHDLISFRRLYEDQKRRIFPFVARQVL